MKPSSIHYNHVLAPKLLILLTFVFLFIISCTEDETPNLVITSITPNSGGEGTEVIISGTGFNSISSENTVTLNDNICTIAESSLTQLTVLIPANAGSGKLTVSTRGQEAQSDVFTFIHPLAITSIVPNSGGKDTQVLINGTGFSSILSENIVTLNDKTCTVTKATDTQLTIIIPAKAGTGSIKVSLGNRTTESSSFEYLFSIAVTTLAGSTRGYADGAGSAAQFDNPAGVAVDAVGNIYVADTGNHKIRKVTPDGTVTTLAGSEEGYADAIGIAAKFNSPMGMTADENGNLYVADFYNHRIRMVTMTGEVSTFAGSTSGFADGVGAAAQFFSPAGVTLDRVGNVYVADYGNSKIRKITMSGEVTTIAGSSYGYENGTALMAKFKSPKGLAIDVHDNIYVADYFNFKIRKITPNGKVTTLAGSVDGDENGTGTDAKFSLPFDVTTDANGNVFMSDHIKHKIRKITPNGEVTTLAGSVSGFADGTNVTSKFRHPGCLVSDSKGDLYVVDSGNHKIRKITID